jgi:hypothetical protein
MTAPTPAASVILDAAHLRKLNGDSATRQAA